jgi:hypothetical protein
MCSYVPIGNSLIDNRAAAKTGWDSDYGTGHSLDANATPWTIISRSNKPSPLVRSIPTATIEKNIYANVRGIVHIGPRDYEHRRRCWYYQAG